MDIAVVGNSPINAGLATAGDLALAGHRVRLAAWPGSESTLEPVVRRGGLELRGDPQQFSSGRLGLAAVTVEDNVREAVLDAQVIFVDVPPSELEARFEVLLPHLRSGQLVHVNSHGYWPALRLWPSVKRAALEEITLTEGSAPTIAAGHADGVVTAQCLRRHVPVSAFPANRNASALETLRVLYPNVKAASNVLETGFAGLNMMVHAAMAILNVGWFDRAEAKDETASFYGGANTFHTGRLGEAQDAERRPVCEAYGVPWRSVHEYLRAYYGARGETLEQLIRGCDYYQALAPQPADAWRKWLASDIPYAHVPFVSLGELAGVAMPIHRALIAVSGALLGKDFWSEGVSLERLGLHGMDTAAVRRYVLTGSAA